MGVNALMDVSHQHMVGLPRIGRPPLRGLGGTGWPFGWQDWPSEIALLVILSAVVGEEDCLGSMRLLPVDD
jgi:hypothetical protein